MQHCCSHFELKPIIIPQHQTQQRMSLQEAIMTLNPLYGFFKELEKEQLDDTSISSTDDSTEVHDIELEVKFSTVDVLEFHPALGDNPACKVGPPITISPQPFRRLTCDVDDWEEQRGIRRSSSQLRLRRKERTAILSQYCSFREMLERQKEMWRIRKSRAKSNQELQHPSVLKLLNHFFANFWASLTNKKRPLGPPSHLM